MKMKTKYFFMLLVACFLGAQNMSAQNNDLDRRPRKRMSIEQVAEMQANRMAESWGLDDKTSAKFKEVYKRYKTELDDLWRKNMPKKPDMKPGEGKRPAPPTDADVDKMMRDRFKLGRKMLDIRERYYDEFRKFLTPKQVEKIYDQGEMDRGKFHREMNRRAGMKKPGGDRRPPMDDLMRDK